MHAALMLLTVGLCFCAGCSHNDDQDEHDGRPYTYDQVGEVRVYDEAHRPRMTSPRTAAPAKHTQLARIAPAQRYDQIGEADVQE